MHNLDPIASLEGDYRAFCLCIQSIPEARFLSPLGGWSPRDVVAHLIGWNRYMIEACRSILRGVTPSYYAEAAINYRDMNAAFVAQYPSKEKEALLGELDLSMSQLVDYLRGLPTDEWDADHGVVYHRSTPASVRHTIASLAGDYRAHREEIQAWLDLGNAAA
jgi:hypothetical protein